MAGGGGGGSGKHKLPEVDLVPILDGMTSVIFFLILSSTFIQLTKVTLPPSQIAPPSANPPSEVVAQTDAPMSPKIFVLRIKNELMVTLTWQGKKPGHIEKKVKIEDDTKRSDQLRDSASEIAKEFRNIFKEEKSIQLGFSGTSTYQQMIDVMDGIRKEIKDIVLLASSEEVVVKTQLGL